jgi:copper(I)-binding protein
VKTVHPSPNEEAFAVFRSRSGKTVTHSLLIGALALLIPATAGCEAGFNAPTLEFHPAAGGATFAVNGIEVSDAFVLGAPVGSALPAGSSASVFLSLFNTGASPDALVKINAPGSASSVHLTGGTVSLPAQSPVELAGPHPFVYLTGLTQPLSGGQSVQLTLIFEHAGQVTIPVPVQPQSFSYSTFSAPPSPAPSAPASPAPSAPPTPTTATAPASPTTPAATKKPAPKPTGTPTP